MNAQQLVDIERRRSQMGRPLLQIAHEAIVTSLEVTQTLTDFDFAIAHFALQSPEYSAFYKKRPFQRLCIMDNGLFECKRPLPVEDVLNAARLTQADWVIPPDNPHDSREARQMLRSFQLLNAGEFPLMPVVCGSTAVEMAVYFQQLCDMNISAVCWPFMKDRLGALKRVFAHGNRNGFNYINRHHFLGVSSMSELRQCLDLLPFNASVSVDTMKPISAAFNAKEFSVPRASTLYTTSLRSKWMRPELNAKIDLRQVCTNVVNFRRNIREFNLSHTHIPLYQTAAAYLQKNTAAKL